MSEMSEMIGLESIQEYRRLIKENKARLTKQVSNCFLMEGFFLPYIEGGRAFYSWFDKGLVIYTSEGEYYNAHYFWEAGEDFSELGCDKRVFISEINNKGSRDEYIDEIAKRLGEVGFKYYKGTEIYSLELVESVGSGAGSDGVSAVEAGACSGAGAVGAEADGVGAAEAGAVDAEYAGSRAEAAGTAASNSPTCSAGKCSIPLLERKTRERLKELESQGITFTDSISPEFFDRIVSLWKERLEETELPLRDRSFDENDLTILALVDGAGEVVGAYSYRLNGKSAEGCHVVTSPAYFHRGIGSLLVKKSMVEAWKQGAKRAYVYIRDDNEESLGMYKRIGYLPTGKTTVHFICE